RIEHLHVGKAVEEDDALDQLVGVLHLLDRFLAPLLGERAIAPIVQQAIVQPILVDGGQLVPQPAVEIFDDGRIALHAALPWQYGPTRGPAAVPEPAVSEKNRPPEAPGHPPAPPPRSRRIGRPHPPRRGRQRGPPPPPPAPRGGPPRVT